MCTNYIWVKIDLHRADTSNHFAVVLSYYVLQCVCYGMSFKDFLFHEWSCNISKKLIGLTWLGDNQKCKEILLKLEGDGTSCAVINQLWSWFFSDISLYGPILLF